ncbi:MAG: hypothetical protein WCQ50_10020 [Spirochaetota bacterium]
MPNWCRTDIVFSGDTGNLDKIAGIFKRPAPFQSIKPCPAELLQSTSPAEQSANKKLHGFKDSHEWCVANWGVKWDAVLEEGSVRRDAEGRLLISLDTPMTPPLPLLLHLSAIHPGVELSYNFEIEHGSGSAGGIIRKGLIARSEEAVEAADILPPDEQEFWTQKEQAIDDYIALDEDWDLDLPEGSLTRPQG